MRGRLSLLLLVFAAGAAAVIGMVSLGAGSAAERDPVQAVLACSECHSMEQEVAEWASSPHADLSCLECHVEADSDWVRQQLLQHGDGADLHKGEQQTIRLGAELQRCATCHEPQIGHVMQDLTPPKLTGMGTALPTAQTGQPMATKALHDRHVNGEPGLSCTTCHLNDVHGPAPGTPERRDETHALCLDCHAQQGVTLAVQGDVSCTACHLDPAVITPADHKEASAWALSHGKASQAGQCGDCHLSASAGTHGALANPAAFQPTEQDACLACHAGLEMPHPADFAARHGREALTASVGTCESCHAPEAGMPATPAPATPLFCSDCHAQPMPHPSNYLASHGAAALESATSCQACHSGTNPVNPTAQHASTTYCATCHSAYQHPSGWVSSHGSQQQESCATCHSMTAEQGGHNACTTCHTGTGEWHEPMWFVKHGKRVTEQGEESCMTCHSEVEPSCAKCHSDR